MPGFIGLPELMLLAVLALVLFGPKRLPEMGRSLGKGLREFKESVGGEHAGLHGIDLDKLSAPVAVETPATETAPLDKAA
jgi:sec-independent protein translocase protein TatA